MTTTTRPRPGLYISSTWRPTPPATAPLYDQLTARTYVPLDDEAVRNLAHQWLRDIAAQAVTR